MKDDSSWSSWQCQRNDFDQTNNLIFSRDIIKLLIESVSYLDPVVQFEKFLESML